MSRTNFRVRSDCSVQSLAPLWERLGWKGSPRATAARERERLGLGLGRAKTAAALAPVGIGTAAAAGMRPVPVKMAVVSTEQLRGSA
jgi:hypothetical protein